MKTSLFALAALLALPIAPAALALDEAGKPVCLQINLIDHTEVLNDHQILFYMNNRKIWLNTLSNRCSTMTRQDGFVWDSSLPKYCENVELIRVLRTGQVCQLGAFTPYEKQPKPS
jgi:hypothetical protein